MFPNTRYKLFTKYFQVLKELSTNSLKGNFAFQNVNQFLTVFLSCKSYSNRKGFKSNKKKFQTKFFSTNFFFEQKFFSNKNFIDQQLFFKKIFSTKNFFQLKIFLTKFFFDQNFLNQIFSNQAFF